MYVWRAPLGPTSARPYSHNPKRRTKQECWPSVATTSPDGYHNAHPDIAFAASSFRNAARFAALLGVDAELAAAWQAALDAMPPYPSADFTFLAGAPGTEFNGGAGFLVEAQYGHHPGMAPNGSAASPPV